MCSWSRKRFSSVAVPLLLLPLMASSSTPIIPGHLFTLRGFVDPSGDQLAANYTVVMMGRGGCGSKGWVRVFPSCEQYGYGYGTRDIVITGNTYWLSVFTCCRPDSIAAAVVLPDTLIVSQVVLTRDLYRSEVEEAYSYGKDGFLCDDRITGSYVSSYIYEAVDSVIIPVP